MTSELINALLKAQTEITPPVNDAKNPFFKSKYATLKNVIDTVREPLNQNGIYFQQKAHLIDGLVGVETVFYGHGGELATGIVPVSPAKSDPQAYGSALSYAKRYSLCMACGIASVDEDDDGEKAMESSREVSPPAKKHAKTKLKPALNRPNDGMYLFKDVHENVIASSDDPATYVELCHKFLGGNSNKDKDEIRAEFLKVYTVNKQQIDDLIPRSSGEAKTRLIKITEFFNEEV